MRWPLRIITGTAKPLSCARHQRGAQSGPRCSSKRTVAEKGNQRFARQRHVDVLQFGKAEVAAFGHGAGGVGAGMAAQRHSREALRIDGIGIEISAQARQAFLTAVVTAPLRGRDVAGERIDGFFDGGDAVPGP